MLNISYNLYIKNLNIYYHVFQIKTCLAGCLELISVQLKNVPVDTSQPPGLIYQFKVTILQGHIKSSVNYFFHDNPSHLEIVVSSSIHPSPFNKQF